MDPEPEPEPPFLRILRGDPSAEDIATLVAVLSSAAGARHAAAPPGGYSWSAPTRLLRSPLLAGHGRWRASALPR